MSKTNPKNFKPYIDPEGGEWIKVTGKDISTKVSHGDQ